MADNRNVDTATAEDDYAPVLARRPVTDSAELDITPMIDIVFLLLIFFLVASIPDASTAVSLPPAKYGKGVSEVKSVIITIAYQEGSKTALIYKADGKVGVPLAGTKEEQAKEIAAYIQEGKDKDNKTSVLIKGEGKVRHGEIARVEAVVGQVGGMTLHEAVLESNQSDQ